MTDLVVISLEAWDEVWRRNQHVIAGLLKTRADLRVLFVEPPEDPLHAWKQKLPRTRGTGLRQVHDLEGVKGRLWAYQGTKWLPRRIDPGGDTRRARRVVQVAQKLGFDLPLLWVNDPQGAEVVDLTRWRTLYDITDDWLAAERPRREADRTAAQERRLLEHVDVVVVCSRALQSKTAGSKSTVLIPNAVDTCAYAQIHARPNDLPKGPYALYVGTLHRDRLDIGLCIETAKAVRGVGELLLLGPIALENAEVNALAEGGVQLLGRRPASSVPAYLQHAAVLVVPHVQSDFTESLDPIKAYEYQASGRPVVATAVPGFRDSDSPLVHVRSGAGFPPMVASLLTDPPVTSTRTGAPDWTERVADFAKIISHLEDR
ncbi:glycosyltransferase [Ornithinimicrobium cerasi]|uniref:glycosyltransferase n=1 Tax=Ornithinimicrobium cerasi TaxID=2248773 RepID=UPI001F379690|nr:glycosyltransferase [Ornithinimicrobium cerasi]